MKNLLILSEHNLRAIRRPLIWTMVLMGPIELGTMLAFLLLKRGPLFHPMHRLFIAAVPVAAACIAVAVLLNFFISLRQNGRSKAIYTLMTLPGNRSQIYFSGVFSGVLSVWLISAAQAVWYILLYAPVNLINNMVSRYYLQIRVNAGLLPQLPDYSSFVDNGFFLNLMRSPTMRMLFPMSLEGLLVLLCSEFCVIACLQSLTCTKGILRGCSAVCCVLCLLTTLLLLMSRMENVFYLSWGPDRAWQIGHGLQLICAALAVFASLYSLRHAKNV